ncbi:hypothetical protein L1049_006073 [Liquidambar formosana]|uniref:Pentatricopeptide repeat-containing protein n=1 Tax=Liquidambar formosana TaxID=63359 RepID=A0AAP0RFC8_LIQFO
MYAKCGHIGHAEKLFEHMSDRTVVSWTSMMSGYCQNGAADEAISIFWQMLENVDPNEYTLAVLLQACAQKGDPKFVEVIHGYTIKLGYVMDKFLQNSLIDAYAKSGILVAAEKLNESSSCRDVVSWTSVISGSVLNGMMKEALGFFIRMQEDGVIPNVVTILSILQACSFINEWWIFQWVLGFVMKAGFCSDSLVMNSLVEMYSINGYYREGLQIFCGFCFAGEDWYLSPETMATLLQGCGHSNYLKLGKQIHGYMIKHRFLPCTVIENSLMDMYAENEQVDFAFLLFTKMSSKDIVSWNTMIRCSVKNDSPCEALLLLSELHSNCDDTISPDFITVLTSIQACSNLASLQLGEVIHGYIIRAGLVGDIFVQNSLIDMYAKSGRLDVAEQIFEEMPVKDLTSWNSIIAAYGINGNGTSALRVFTELKKLGIHQLNSVTFVNILSACAHAGLVKEGLEIFASMGRAYDVEPRMEHFACVVDLLGKSGRIEEAEAFIENMRLRTWPCLVGCSIGCLWALW